MLHRGWVFPKYGLRTLGIYAEFTSIRDPEGLRRQVYAVCVTTMRVFLSMTMRRDIRAIGGTAFRPVPHAALTLAGLLLLTCP